MSTKKDYAAIARSYISDVLDGTIPACKETKQACQRQLDDLERQGTPEFPFIWNQAKVNHFLRFVDSCPHIKGKAARTPGFKLEPWQVFVLGTPFGWLHMDSGLRRIRRVYVEVAKGNGKAVDVNTLVPSPAGMKPMRDIHPGSLVFGSDGKPTAVIAESEIFVGDCYELEFSSGERIVADSNHLWLTTALADRPGVVPSGYKHGQSVKTRVRTTKEIYNTLFAGGKHGGTPLVNHRIAVAPPSQLSSRVYPITPYTLGVWLGDGSSDTASFTSADIEVVGLVSLDEPVYWAGNKPNNKASEYTLSDGNQARDGHMFVSRLRSLGVLKNKHVPEDYFLGSVEQRTELLRGLMDTDGSASKNGQLEFTNCNERLAADVKRLICSLGFKATIHEYDATLNGEIVGRKWRVGFWAYDDTPVFNLPRKAVRQKSKPASRSLQNNRTIVGVRKVPNTPVKCIQVAAPDGLFLLTDGYIPTHNSPMMSGVISYTGFFDGEPGAEVYTAATSTKQARLVFDVCQAMLRKMPKFTEPRGIEIGAHSINQISSNSFIRPLSSEAKGVEGINPYFICVDELHAHDSRDLYDNIDTANGKREGSMLWAITTAGDNRHGICYEVRTYLKKMVLDKPIGQRDESVWGIIYTIDEEDQNDWIGKPEVWKKANPNWGVCVNPEEIGLKAHAAAQMVSKQASFLTKHLNVWVNAYHRWMDMPRFYKCADPELSEANFIGQKCVIGTDLAAKLDICAKMKVFWKELPTKITDPKTGEVVTKNMMHYYAFGTYWTPDARVEAGINPAYPGWKTDGWLTSGGVETNDYDLVEESIKEDCGKYQVLEIDSDPWQATQMITRLQGKFPLVVIDQNVKNLSDPMKELEAAIYDGRFHYAEDPVLAWAVSNVVCKLDKNDNVYPVKEKAEDKIDPCTALITALVGVMKFAKLAPQGNGVTSFGNCSKCGEMCIGKLHGENMLYLCKKHEDSHGK